MKNIKGITLISLVITIIVIIILCIVATNYLFGNEGVLNNAKVATETYNKSMEGETIDKVFGELKIKRDINESIDEITARLIEEGIAKRGYNVSVEDENENFIITFLNTGNIFVVDDDGTLVEERKTNPVIDETTTYIVAYMANGGSGTMESTRGQTVTIASNTFTAPTGKVFKEWNTNSSGTGTTYTAGTTVDSNLTLYAIWRDSIPLSQKVQVGDYITYNPTLDVMDTSVLNYTSQLGTLKIKNSNNEYVVKEAGNTIEYNGAYNLLNENGEFIIPSGYTTDKNGNVSGNGHGSQNFTASETNIVWRVLDVRNGIIKIVPETPIQTTANDNFWLNGLRGYKNSITELNNISAIFGHGQGANGAVSITVEEINALTGYTVTPPVSTTPVGEIGSWYNTSYYYEKDNNLASNIKSMIFKNSYWLASNCINITSGNGATFIVRRVNSNGVYNYGLYGIQPQRI